MKPGKTMWRLWAKALGQKEGTSDREANIVAFIRTVLIILSLLFSAWSAYTNYQIIKGIEKHWND
jgi:hypothetical protein